MRKGFIYKGNLKQNIKRNSYTFQMKPNKNKLLNKNRISGNLYMMEKNISNNTKNDDEDSLFKELYDFYDAETNFSFCSTNKEKAFNNMIYQLLKI